MSWLVCPAHCPGITPLPAPWIAKSIVAKWPVSHAIFLLPGLGSIPSLILFFLVCSGVSRSRLSSNSPLAHPPLPLPSTMSIELGSGFWVPKFSCWIFFLRFPDYPGGPTRLPHLSVGSPSHLWIRRQPLGTYDGWFYHGWFDFRERDRFPTRRWCRVVCSWRRRHQSGLWRLASENDLSDQFLSQGQSWQSLTWLSYFECFLGNHCLLRHHTQWIIPLHIGLYHTSISTLIRLSTSKKYDGWIKPIQYRLHLSTVQCVIRLCNSL